MSRIPYAIVGFEDGDKLKDSVGHKTRMWAASRS